MNQTITIYHGSRMVIRKPAFGMGNSNNDYGLGFYCTREIEIAKEWACGEESGGFANQYELDLSELSVMALSGERYHILNWLALLVDNRRFRLSNDIAAEGKDYLTSVFLPDISSYDIITGYRADDSYFAFANAFLNSALSLEQLSAAMRLGKLGEQTVLKSPKAFDQLRYVHSEPANRETYYPLRSTRDREAREAFKKERSTQRTLDAVYILDIMRGGWQNGDSRIPRNLPE